MTFSLEISLSLFHYIFSIYAQPSHRKRLLLFHLQTANKRDFLLFPLSRNLDIKMGSEQSQQANAANANGRMNNQSRLQRGHTIAVTGRRLSSPNDDFAAGQAPPDSRPVSPPISVCSDSDLPYVSYTDKLGGEFFLSLLFCHQYVKT